MAGNRESEIGNGKNVKLSRFLRPQSTSSEVMLTIPYSPFSIPGFP
jgi:hypothetical protein